MGWRPAALLTWGLMMILPVEADQAGTGVLVGRIVDDETGEAIPARVYIADGAGGFHFPLPQPKGSVVVHDNTDRGTGIREAYAAVGPIPFRAELPAGRYRVTVERGKEYVPLTREIDVTAGQTVDQTFRLVRRFDMAELGWYSADCHVHTKLDVLPLMQLADDVNVAFPITAWATRSEDVPANLAGGHVPATGRWVAVDDAHGYWDLNTEYEIFSVGGERVTLGAFLILGHTEPIKAKVPPVGPVAEAAKRQGAVLDWEKHTWPWSTMLVPVAAIDTMELSHNSMWRQRTIHTYLWGREPPPWLPKPLDVGGFLDYGFDSFYAVLNCGFDLKPSAGTANGVHPVPLGHSRVYVHVDGRFSYEKWMEGFRRGKSFATNGPMLLLDVDGHPPGDRVALSPGEPRSVGVTVDVLSVGIIDRVELIVNGEIRRLEDVERSEDAARLRFQTRVRIDGSTWLAARCFERAAEDNPRFAHTGAVFFDDATRPLKPQPRQIRYLIDSVKAQIAGLEEKLPDEALAEYREALAAYEAIARQAGVPLDAPAP